MTKSYKTTLALSVIAATAVAFIIGPALMQSASAVPADKTVVTPARCSEEKFADRPSCPGESEDAPGNPGDREDEPEQCIARNPGQAKNCPDGTADDTVNPPK